MINEVVVFPTTETLDYLLKIFQDCPFSIEPETWFVTLNETREPCKLYPDRVYSASPQTLGLWYDDSLNGTSLLMPLDSQDILERMAELRLQNGFMCHPSPLAFMPLVRYMPQLKHNYRAFINSISYILSMAEQPLLFTGETQVMREVESSPYRLYYIDRGAE